MCFGLCSNLSTLLMSVNRHEKVAHFRCEGEREEKLEAKLFRCEHLYCSGGYDYFDYFTPLQVEDYKNIPCLAESKMRF